MRISLDPESPPARGREAPTHLSSCGARVLTSGPSRLTPNKLHRLGSITKTYVAALVLSLAREGLLRLDEPIGRWVPDVTGADVITVRELMNHSSGIFNYTEDNNFNAASTNTAISPKELVAIANRHDPYFAPGRGWHYSNTNYIILGMISEALGGASVAAMIRARVLERAHLRATFFEGEDVVSGDLAGPVSSADQDTPRARPASAWAAGAMVATPDDVASWMEQVGSGRFYGSATERELLTTVSTGTAVEYGLGIMVFPRTITGAGPAIGHFGDISGYHSQALYFTESATTIVSIVDSDTDSPANVMRSALLVLCGSGQ